MKTAGAALLAPSALPAFYRHRKPLLTPNTFDLLVVDLEAFPAKCLPGLAAALTWVLGG